MPNIGPLEIILVLLVALIIFGPKRLPDLGRSLGRGMREFKDSVTGKDNDDDPRPEIEHKVDAAEPRPTEEREPSQGARAGDAPS